MPMQYVGCKFRPEDSRVYTYENDGEPVEVGDFVKVADARSDGWKRVQVVSLSDEAPSFKCKPILGRVEVEQENTATRCPTCGRRVKSIFDHIDEECQDWPDRSEDERPSDAQEPAEADLLQSVMEG